MNADKLLRHYERMADAPDAVERLRRFVLDLAVRGKLVTQDPRDEPASVALRRIADERAKAAKSPATRQRISPTDLPAALPNGWAAVRFEQILLELQTGPFGSSLHQSDYVASGTPVINPASLQGERIVPIDRMAVGPATLDRLATFKLRAGDVVMARRGEMGRCAVVTKSEEGWLCGTGSLILRLSSQLCARFVVLLVGSPSVRDYLGGRAVGATMQNLNQGILLNLVIGLPPLAEQHRIVAKVDELMALCDRLEAARAQREAARDRLARSCLVRLDTPDPETFHEDVRFALDALPALTARPDQIKQLRQTILNLAVRGKLALPDLPCNAARPALRPMGKAPNGMDLDVFERFRSSLVLPESWHIAPLAAVAEHIVDCLHTTPMWTDHGEICVRTNQLRPRFLDLSDLRYVSRETYLERVERLEPREDDILYSREGGILGITCRVPKDVRLCLGQRLMLIRAEKEVAPDFLEVVLNSAFITTIARTLTTGGAAPRVNMSTVRAYPIPFPPRNEQQRIVAKVNELMALCDRLEASLQQGDNHRRRLLETLLHDALAPAAALEEQAA